MIRALAILIVAIHLLLLPARPASAWVMMGVLPKGEVPEQYCSKNLTAVVKKVRPIRGETIDGFSHYSCTLYYRGTHDDVQDLIDGLAKVKNVKLIINFDRTGKVGKLVSREVYPMKRPLHYLYRVSLSWHQLVDLGTITPSPQPLSIGVVVYSAGGTDVDRLEIPDKAFGAAVNRKAESLDKERESTNGSNAESQ